MLRNGMTWMLACLAIALAMNRAAMAQESPPKKAALPTTAEAAGAATPQKVDIAPAARDADIAARLRKICEATGWFTGVTIDVDEGVVFLSGIAENEQAKEWASDLARRTEDVVAVVNRMQLAPAALWNLEPASRGMSDLWRDGLALTPFIIFGLIVLVVSSVAAYFSVSLARTTLRRSVSASLLREVLARTVGVTVFLFGLYIVLRISGLTRLALTVVGGTGILGLVIGIAFRDITENFLASIFLSLQRPFMVGDLVEIVSVLGYVQRLTIRTTVVMTLNGNQVEIPNSTVYKSTIRNFTSNKNRREDFTVGIGYDVPIPMAQETALRVLREHPAVLKDPEPWALVDSLGAATVVLRVYFWIDGSEHSWLKVRSSVIRLVKRAFQDAGIDMPDEARGVVFPRGVPVRMVEEQRSEPTEADGEASNRPNADSPSPAAEPVTTSAEGGLSSESDDIEDQVRKSRPSKAENLLKHSANSAAR